MKFNKLVEKAVLTEKVDTDDDMGFVAKTLKSYKGKGSANNLEGDFEFTVAGNKVNIEYEYGPNGDKEYMTVSINGKEYANDVDIMLDEYLGMLINYLEHRDEAKTLEDRLGFSID